MTAFLFWVRLVALFFLGTSFGWVLELFFRRAVHKKWVNPGFLVGPCLPIYGFGTVFLYLISLLETPLLNAGIHKVWVVVIICLVIGVTMTLIEYLAGIIFIKGMNVKLWDYSDRWGNLDGIICPLFSAIWLVIGALYYFFLHHPMVLFGNWINENPWTFYILGFASGMLLIDFCYSAHVVNRVKKFAKEKGIYVKWELLKESVTAFNKEHKEKVSFINPFRNANLKESLQELKDKAFDYIEKKKNKDE